MLVRLVTQHLGVAEVDELEHPGDDAAGPPDDQGVELHLEQRLGLEELARRTAGLVVDDPQLTRGCLVDPIDVAVDRESGLQLVDDVDLALGGLEPLRILEGEVAAEQIAALLQPSLEVRLRR